MTAKPGKKHRRRHRRRTRRHRTEYKTVRQPRVHPAGHQALEDPSPYTNLRALRQPNRHISHQRGPHDVSRQRTSHGLRRHLEHAASVRRHDYERHRLEQRRRVLERQRSHRRYPAPPAIQYLRRGKYRHVRILPTMTDIATAWDASALINVLNAKLTTATIL